MLRIGADESEENLRSVKQIYRTLAKQLHPDQNPGAGELEKELWSEAQIAYQAGNALALQSIELRYRLDRGVQLTPNDLSLFELVVEELSELRSFSRHELRDAQDDPAWGFAQLSPEDKNALAREGHEIFDQEIARLQRDLNGLRRKEAKLAAPPPPRKSPPARRPPASPPGRPHQLEMPF
jgi:hypothetical protein